MPVHAAAETNCIGPTSEASRTAAVSSAKSDDFFKTPAFNILESPDEVRFDDEARTLAGKIVARDERRFLPLRWREVDERFVYVRGAHRCDGVHIIFPVSRERYGIPCFQFRDAVEGLVHLVADHGVARRVREKDR